LKAFKRYSYQRDTYLTLFNHKKECHAEHG